VGNQDEMGVKEIDTRRITAEYRQAHWLAIFRNRQESGLNVKSYCERIGIHENTYYYWQRKLRESAYREVQKNNEGNQSKTGIVPKGWAVCEIQSPQKETRVDSQEPIRIRIGRCLFELPRDINNATISSIIETIIRSAGETQKVSPC
jgi:transposase-like protein